MLRPRGEALRAVVLGIERRSGIGKEERLQYGVKYGSPAQHSEYDESPDEDVIESERHVRNRHHRIIPVMDVETDYHETDDERILELSRENKKVSVSVTKTGYGMLIVADETGELERYYGLDMALDHAAEVLSASPTEIDLPDEAREMGM